MSEEPGRQAGVRWRRAALPLLVAGLALGLWAYGQRQWHLRYRQQLEAVYQREFHAALDASEQMQLALGKAMAAASGEQEVTLLLDAWGRAAQAQEALGRLPFPPGTVTRTSKFLAQVGDYARSLAQQRAGGRPLSPAQLSTLARLEDEASLLNRHLHALQSSLRGRLHPWTTLAARQAPAPTAGRAARAAGGPPDQIQAFRSMEERLARLPALNYDGPLSDHLEEVKPRGLPPGRVEAAAARRTAERFLAPLGRYRARGETASVGGRLPAFSVTLAAPGLAPCRADVSRQGGRVLLFLCYRPVGQSRLTPEEAAGRAARFLMRIGFTGLVPVSSSGEGGVQTVAFAATAAMPDAAAAPSPPFARAAPAGGAPGGAARGRGTSGSDTGRVILYPDLIKVAVARDDGTVLGFDATQYYVSHRDRRLPRPRLTAEEARARALGGAPGATAAAPRPALIPLPGGRETLAWEVTVRHRDGVYLVYINADDGREERVARLVPVPGGTLVQ